MRDTDSATADVTQDILAAVRRYWGYRSLRPSQDEAIQAELEHRDSVVVLPTGGGKSLCYQVPPIVSGRTDVVVSPLISLMKDQVDGLRANDYPAAALHSGMSQQERSETIREIYGGKFRLIFVSPERALSPWFLGLAEQLKVRAFAIDEAHCISHWGHDFRPEYRQMAALKQRFPSASIHAYTATATQRVSEDIAVQLGLHEPAMLIGVFDRPNLTYRVIPRLDLKRQVVDVVRRHRSEAVIVYCLSRKDTEKMASNLKDAGIEARPYHAGLSPDQRRRTQDAFADESLNVITATVAFGMGVDRSNVRCVVHATMPKTIEHYQQETGRAGRDGLEAECIMFYSAADAIRWESLMRRSAEESDDPKPNIEPQMQLLGQMRKFCATLGCRHQALSEYFGQDYPKDDCQACDVCLNETADVDDATVTVQKILSCVARVEQRFGAKHVAEVLAGADTEMIRQRGHNHLSTFGLLQGTPRKTLTNWIYQLVDQGLLDRTPGDYPLLVLNNVSWEVMRGERSVKLRTPKSVVTKTRAAEKSWEGVDRSLFEHLRGVRTSVARQLGLPPFMVFGDNSLRDMARLRPTTSEAFLAVHGVGAAKLKKHGKRFTKAIGEYCEEYGLAVDCVDTPE